MNFKLVLKLVFSLGLLAILAVWVDLESVRSAFADANFAFILVALLLVTAGRILMAIKWNALLLAKRIRIPWGIAIKFYYISGFVGIFLPITVGADAVRCILTIKKYDHHADVISSVFVERLLGLFVLLIFGSLGGIVLYQFFENLEVNPQRLVVAAAILLVLVLGCTLFIFLPICGRMIAALSRRFQEYPRAKKLTIFVQKLHNSLHEYRGHTPTILLFLLLTVIENILPIVTVWIIGLSMNVGVPILYYVVVVPIALFVKRMPVSFGGLGLQEGVFIYFLSLVGVDNGIAFSMSLAQYFLGVISLLPGAIFYLSYKDVIRSATPQRES